MTDILDRLQQAMHEESAFHAPRTTKAIEAMREAKAEIERLTAELKEREWCYRTASERDAEIERLQALALEAATWLEDEGALAAGADIRRRVLAAGAHVQEATG